jgi:tetratricopeptide (TPR) repeat protein
MKQLTLVHLFIGIGTLLLVMTVFGVSHRYFEMRTTESAQNYQDIAPPESIADDHFALGEYYFNQPPYNNAEVYDLEKAQHHYNQSIIQAVNRGEAVPTFTWYNLARIDFVQARLDGAVSKLEKQLVVHGDAVPQTYYMLGLAYGYRALETESVADWEAAEAGFVKFMEYAPDSPWPRVDLAWVYFGQGKFKEMLPLLEEGIAISSDHAWLLNTYGLALLNTGDRAGALQAFTQAQQAYQNLTVADWQQAYSENDPSYWNRNFELFGATIDYNLSLAEEK